MPFKLDTLVVPYCDVLTQIEMTTQTGRTYKCSTKEQDKADKALAQYLKQMK